MWTRFKSTSLGNNDWEALVPYRLNVVNIHNHAPRLASI